MANNPRYHVNGGFFWMQDNQAPVYLPGDAGIAVSNSVFMQRPRWYQIGAWWKALKYWLNLPHAKNADAPCIVEERVDG